MHRHACAYFLNPLIRWSHGEEMFRSIQRLNSVCIIAWIDSLRRFIHLQTLMSNLMSIKTSEDCLAS